ncbi:MAG: hypothetical protein WC758_03080 [Candidatus Woesearchaeota archaeon]|jgi:hypothetical protein
MKTINDSKNKKQFKHESMSLFQKVNLSNLKLIKINGKKGMALKLVIGLIFLALLIVLIIRFLFYSDMGSEWITQIFG